MSGLYLGNLARNSLVGLQTFMDALRMTGCPDPEPPFGGLACWVGCKGIPGTLPWYWMVQQLGDEAAFNRFFELYDEYRQCRRVVLQRAILHNQKANFTTKEEHPQRPLEMLISQFAPSKAFSLTEIYVDHVRGEWTFYGSIAQAKRVARNFWNVRAKDWMPIEDQCKPRVFREGKRKNAT